MNKADRLNAEDLAGKMSRKVYNTSIDYANHIIGNVDEEQREQVIKAVSEDFRAGAECFAKIMRDHLCPADLRKYQNALKIFVPRKQKLPPHLKKQKGGKHA